MNTLAIQYLISERAIYTILRKKGRENSYPSLRPEG